jgi:uncharacterized protein HemX
VEPEPRDDFERELRETMQRQPAPPGLKRKIFEHRSRVPARRFPSLWIFQSEPAAAALATMILVVVVAAAGVGDIFLKRQAEERRRGEEAKQQVFTALRITNHALRQVNAQLAEQDRKKQ